MNSAQIYRLAGLAAVISGTLFAAIQFIHPVETLEALTTHQWGVAHLLSVIFPVFGLLGITGIYVRQMKASGWPGLIGYLLLFGAFSLMLCFGFYEAFIAPLLATEAPGLALGVMSILDGESGPGYLGEVYQLNGILYLFGGLVFAIATMKAKIFPLYASGLLAAGVLVTLSAAALPALARPSAVVFSLGLGLLGYSLFRMAGKAQPV